MPVTAKGTYKVSLLKDGSVIKTISVTAAQGTTPAKPAEQGKGPDLVLILGIVILLIAIVGGLLYMRGQPKNGAKSNYGKKTSSS